MIFCAINNYHRVFAPLGSLLVQAKCKGPEKQLHHLRVGICLGQGNVDISQGVKSQNHGDPRSDLYLGNGICGPRFLPLHAPEVCHAQPSLIYIQKDLLFTSLVQKFKGPALSKNQVFLGIGVQRDCLNLTEMHAKILLHNLSNSPCCHLVPTRGVYVICYCLCGVNNVVEVVFNLNSFLDELPLVLFKSNFCHDLPHERRILLGLVHQGRHNLW